MHWGAYDLEAQLKTPIERRSLLRLGGAIAAAALIPSGLSTPAAAAPVQVPLALAIRHLAATDRELAAFYGARGYRPLWVHGSAIGVEARSFLDLLATAHADGLDPNSYLRSGVAHAVAGASSGEPTAVARAEILLSKAFAQYVKDLRRPVDLDVVYGEPWLRGGAPNTLTILSRAAAAPSLHAYLENIGWMHPVYAGLRRALANPTAEAGVDVQLLRLNLERARILPGDASRYVLVNVPAARLIYYEDGQRVDSMRVVVGTPQEATPMMVGMLRYATLNPYWHVPPDLTRKRIAPRVLSDGMSYFNSRGYEVVTEWSTAATVLDPAKVDWKAVADGRTEILVRQRPGPRNGMGNVKFQFPNELGIYLHDTPAKQLFNEDQRGFSAGCVRLEDAERLGRLLFGRELLSTTSKPEHTVAIPQPVPVYITYLTAVPDGGRIVQRKDIYGLDSQQLAVRSDTSQRAGAH